MRKIASAGREFRKRVNPDPCTNAAGRDVDAIDGFDPKIDGDPLHALEAFANVATVRGQSVIAALTIRYAARAFRYPTLT
ncbi:protein of unknown function [Pararobbsia alpina]